MGTLVCCAGETCTPVQRAEGLIAHCGGWCCLVPPFPNFVAKVLHSALLPCAADPGPRQDHWQHALPVAASV